MIVLFLAAAPILALSVWLYLKAAPPGTTLKSRARFEAVVLLLELAGCAVAGYLAYVAVGQGVDRAWWPVVAVIYGLVLVPSLLIPAALVRRRVYRKLATSGRLEN
jgi:hypothetical protein